MANELRVRQNFLGGLIEDNPLTSGATTLNSAALAAMVVIGSTQHLPITLDPDGLYGEPEIVYVTAHTASAASATILRAQEGTTARAHSQDVVWVHGPTAQDFDPVYVGVKVTKSAAQSLSDGASTVLTWNAEDWDTHSFHDNATDNSRLTIPAAARAGKYRVLLHAAWDASGSGVRQAWLRKNGVTGTAYGTIMAPSSAGGGTGGMTSVDFQLAVGDYVEAVAYQDSGGALNFRGTTETSFSMQRIGD